MRIVTRLVPSLLLAACGVPPAPVTAPAPLASPDVVAILGTATGEALDPTELLRRLAGTDLVLLGELHDNTAHHRIRGALLTAVAPHRPAVVFEQFARTAAPIPPPDAGQSMHDWLDAHGFDRAAWRWPLHEPVIEAARSRGLALWGSGVSREALRAVVRDGAAGAPDDLRHLVEQTPLDSSARAAMDHALVEGHCGQLPESMIPGMRAAQEVRDAAMTRALLAAGAGGSAWLIAGNGHVRSDVAVPRLLRQAAPGRTLLAVGLLEQGPDGALPDPAERGRYDVVIVTPRAERSDPCATFRR